VPRTRRRIGDRAFSLAAPRAWNRLRAPGYGLTLWCALSLLVGAQYKCLSYSYSTVVLYCNSTISTDWHDIRTNGQSAMDNVAFYGEGGASQLDAHNTASAVEQSFQRAPDSSTLWCAILLYVSPGSVMNINEMTGWQL